MHDLKRILLTNDDGVDAKGIKILHDILSGKFAVLIVAPLRCCNAMSHAITLRRKINVKRISGNIIGVDGTPTDAVTFGVHEFGKPDLLISGINDGPNLGEDVTYSGTVGAALEGAILGIPSIAVSFVSDTEVDPVTLSKFIIDLAEKVLKNGLPNGIFLNVNIPPFPKGVKITRLGHRLYRDVLRKHSSTSFEITGEPVTLVESGTDIEAIEANYISITPLRIDLTAEEFIPKLREML